MIYTRYADDIILSCNDEVLLIKTKKIVSAIVCDEGFKINQSKVKFMGISSAKRITGLHIEKNKVVVPRKLKRKVRTMIHHTVVIGDYSDVDKIKGYIAFISSIEPNYRKKVSAYINKITSKQQYQIFEEIVNEYNSNKILQECNDMEYSNEKYNEDIENDFYRERENFINMLLKEKNNAGSYD